jgi:hypothetical protein
MPHTVVKHCSCCGWRQFRRGSGVLHLLVLLVLMLLLLLVVVMHHSCG